MKYYLFVFFCFLASSSMFAQFIDSNKDVVYQIDKPQTTQIKFNGNEISFEGNYLRLLRFYSVAKDTSAVKADVIGIKFGLVNSNKILDVDDFDFRDYGIQLQINYKWTLKDSIYSNRNVTTGAIGLKYQIDRFKLYDSDIDQVDRKSPYELSLVGNLTKYYSNYSWAISITGVYNFITYNRNELLNFKDVTDIIQNNNIVAFDSFDGKYGVLDNNLNGARMSFAFPIFFKNRVWKYFPYLIPTPYYSLRLTKDIKPNHNLGFSFNFSGSQPFKDNKFNVPSSFGFGIDWSNSNNKWSKANIFLSGSITIE